jgi:hypothetical protein
MGKNRGKNAREAGRTRAKETYARRKRVRRRKLKRTRERRAERWRQVQQRIAERVAAGFEIIGECFDPAALDDSCPF